MTKDTYTFIIYMIHICSKRWHISPSRVYGLLKKSGCLTSFLIPNYDILHTQSSNFIAQDIEEYLKERKVSL